MGLTAVKGLAEAAGRPVIAVSNLQALAWFGIGPLRAVLVDARRGEIYGAVYNSALELVQEEVVMKLDAWLAQLPTTGDMEFVIPLILSEAEHGIADALSQGWFAGKVTQAPRVLAGAMGKIALDRFERGWAQDPAEMDANYVRRADAEMLWKDPHAV
jgi:tRNA threonylcarbamoyladenosine biosynthesis protein TsaB